MYIFYPNLDTTLLTLALHLIYNYAMWGDLIKKTCIYFVGAWIIARFVMLHRFMLKPINIKKLTAYFHIVHFFTVTKPFHKGRMNWVIITIWRESIVRDCTTLQILTLKSKSLHCAVTHAGATAYADQWERRDGPVRHSLIPAWYQVKWRFSSQTLKRRDTFKTFINVSSQITTHPQTFDISDYQYF